MDKLKYSRNSSGDTREPNDIEFTIPSDLNIYEFKIVCIRLAKALGYSDDNITNIFGKIDVDFEDMEFNMKSNRKILND